MLHFEGQPLTSDTSSVLRSIAQILGLCINVKLSRLFRETNSWLDTCIIKHRNANQQAKLGLLKSKSQVE